LSLASFSLYEVLQVMSLRVVKEVVRARGEVERGAPAVFHSLRFVLLRRPPRIQYLVTRDVNRHLQRRLRDSLASITTTTAAIHTVEYDPFIKSQLGSHN